jgi:hypothetical protein
LLTSRRIGIVVGFAAITAISLAPFSVKRALGTNSAFHNMGHVLVFAASASFVIYGCAKPSARAVRLAFVLLFAVATEFLEKTLYHNLFEWSDLVLDSVGIAFSPLIVYACNTLNWGTHGRS